jgi:hypothetical protein
VKRLATLPGGARDEYHPTAALEPARGRPAREEDGVEILGQRSAPAVVAHVGERHLVGGPDAGVADEDIQASERFSRTRDKLLGAVARGDVGGMSRRADTESPQPLGNRLGVGAPCPIANDDVGAALGEQQGGRGADAARAAGDERALADQRDQRSRSTRSQMMC